MPRFSALGAIAAGMSGYKVSINREVYAEPAGGAEWLDAHRVVFNAKVGEPDTWRLTIGGVGLAPVEAYPEGMHDIAAGGLVWAAWNPRGLVSNLHPPMPRAGLKAVGPDGTLAYTPDRQSGLGLILRAPDGQETHVTDTGSLAVQVIDRVNALWWQGGKIRSTLGDPVVGPGQVSGARTVVHQGQRYLLYHVEVGGKGRLILQPDWRTARGWVLTEGDAHRPDLVSVNGHLRVCWSTTEAEGPTSIRDLTIDLTRPQVSLVFTAPTPVPTPTPPPEEPIEMPTWNDDYRATLLRYEAKFPIPKGTGEEAARNWTHALAEYFKFVHGPAFGHKSAGPGRPHSADALAFSEGNRLYAWDVLGDAGGPDCRLFERPGTLDITGQVFEVVSAVDHVGAGAPAPTPIPPPPPAPEPCRFTPCVPEPCRFQPTPAVDLTEIHAKLDALAADNHKPRRLDGLRWVGTGTLSGVVED